MDYTKVLSKIERTKDALAKKLDSIKSDVTNVNNSVTNLPTTLDSKFSALTSKVDGVKTDVAGVGGKVDTLGGKVDSAQTAISNKVQASSNEIKKMLDKNGTIMGFTPRTDKNQRIMKTLSAPDSGTMTEVFSVKNGGGFLQGFEIFPNGGTDYGSGRVYPELKIIADGKVVIHIIFEGWLNSVSWSLLSLEDTLNTGTLEKVYFYCSNGQTRTIALKDSPVELSYFRNTLKVYDRGSNLVVTMLNSIRFNNSLSIMFRKNSGGKQPIIYYQLNK